MTGDDILAAVHAERPKRCRHQWGREVLSDWRQGDLSPSTSSSLTPPISPTVRITGMSLGPTSCSRCGRIRDEARARRGRNNRTRGGRFERQIADSLGGRKVGPLGGPEDVLSGPFVAQAKTFSAGRFPGWMADELAKLPRTDGRTPILVVGEAGHNGPRRRRVLVVLTLDDWRGLHGESGT